MIARSIVLVGLIRATAAMASPESDAAARLIAEGIESAEHADYTTACARFAAARALCDDVRAQGLEAGCNEKLGLLATAWNGFDHLRALAEAAGDRESGVFAAAAMARLAPRLAHVTIEVRDADGTTTVTIDGNTLGRERWGTRVAIDAGDHEVRVESATRIGRRERFSNIDGEDVRRWMSAATPDAPRSLRHQIALVNVGAGVVGLAVAGWFALDAERTWQDARATGCDETGTCTTSASEQMLRDAHRSADIATWSTVAGAAIAAAGVVMLVTEQHDQRPSAWTISAFANGRGGALTIEKELR